MSTEYKTQYNETTKTWYGKQVGNPFGPNDSIGKVVLESLLKRPEHIAQIATESGKKYTNREMAKLSICFAQHFDKLNLQQGDIITILGSIKHELIAPIFYGAMLNGLCVSPTGPFNRTIFKHIFQMTKCKVVFIEGENYQILKEILEECNSLETKIYTLKNHVDGLDRVDDLIKENILEDEFTVPKLKFGLDQLAVILFSSGTTGLQKGINLSHNQLLNGFEVKYKPLETFLSYVDLAWRGVMTYFIHSTIIGFTILTTESHFTPEHFCDILKQYKPNYVIGAPAYVKQLVESPYIKQADFSSLKVFITASAAMPYKLVEELKAFAKNTKVVIRYAMSEMTGLVALSEGQSDNSYDQLNVNASVTIQNDNGNHLGPGEIGEICVTSTIPSLDYYDNNRERSTLFKGDAFHTGDLGYFDDKNHLHFLDRRANKLLYNEYYVIPSCVERVIYQLPQVAEACVVGLDDIIATELPAAAIVLKPNMILSVEEISQHVADKMEDFEQLRGGVYFFDKLPKSSRGKIQARKVKEMVRSLRINHAE